MWQREFILAISLFAVMAVVGTGFGLWYVTYFSPINPAHTTNAVQ
jgi:hypothetical protein